GLVEDARRTWRERAHIGDLAAVAARSRVTEADALLDPAGLGGFAVLEWRPRGGGRRPVPGGPSCGPGRRPGRARPGPTRRRRRRPAPPRRRPPPRAGPRCPTG